MDHVPPPPLPPDPARDHRPLLSRDTICAVACTIARREGITAVTMRRVAAELDTAAMSLYRHVADRADLLSAMLDEVAGGIELPAAADDPRDDLRAVVTAVHDALAQDPWAVQVVVVEQSASPRFVPVVERVFAALQTLGLDAPRRIDACWLLFQFLYGEVLTTHHDRREASPARQSITAAADHTRFPAIAHTVAGTAPVHPPHFPDNLRRVVDGIAAGATPDQ